MKNKLHKLIRMMTAVILAMSVISCGSPGAPQEKPQEEQEAEAETGEDTQASEEEAEAPEKTGETEEQQAETTVQANDWSVMYVENGGLKLPVPESLTELLVIETPEDSDQGILFNFSEKRSVETAEKSGADSSGAGWLFGIIRLSEETAKEYVENDIPGIEIIAKDAEGNCYASIHPTDARVVREIGEYSEESLKDWSMLNVWATLAPGDFIRENEGLSVSDIDHRELNAESFANGYFKPVGEVPNGTAGSSLALANEAVETVCFAAGYRLEAADTETLRSMMLSGWESLTEEEQKAFDTNFMSIIYLLDSCQQDWAANRGLFEDAGCADKMDLIIHSPSAIDAWDILKANTLTMGNSDGE